MAWRCCLLWARSCSALVKLARAISTWLAKVCTLCCSWSKVLSCSSWALSDPWAKFRFFQARWKVLAALVANSCLAGNCRSISSSFAKSLRSSSRWASSRICSGTMIWARFSSAALIAASFSEKASLHSSRARKAASWRLWADLSSMAKLSKALCAKRERSVWRMRSQFQVGPRRMRFAANSWAKRWQFASWAGRRSEAVRKMPFCSVRLKSFGNSAKSTVFGVRLAKFSSSFLHFSVCLAQA